MPIIRRSNKATRTSRLICASRVDTATAASRDLGPCVYAVRTPDRLIKIGFTTDLDRRIRQFGCRWTDVLFALPGSLDDERLLHERFAPYLARGRESVPLARRQAMAAAGNTTARGYGATHQRIRRESISAAYGMECTRCGQVMDEGQLLDLDHTDDRSGYAGYAHRSCNRSAGATAGNLARAGADPEPTPRTRW